MKINIKNIITENTIINFGKYKNKNMTMWDLLNSHISEKCLTQEDCEKRRYLLWMMSTFDNLKLSEFFVETCKTYELFYYKEALTMPYAEQLKHEKWYIKREKIKLRDKNKCVKCGSSVLLQVHHLSYKKGRFAWQYPDSNFITLCAKCHAKQHKHVV